MGLFIRISLKTKMEEFTMKKTLIVFSFFAAVCGFSQTQMHIYEKNGNLTTIPVDQIDRITFEDGAPAMLSNTVTDFDGNVYPVVKIGEQYWMGENLRVTKLRDGTPIANVTRDDEWSSLTTPGYCWYNNNTSFKNDYGALYNYMAIETNRVCPAGWRVPTNDDWGVLLDNLGGSNDAGGKLKERGTAFWYPPNAGATNLVGFNARPAGFRNAYPTNMKFDYVGTYTFYWSSNRYTFSLSHTEERVRGAINSGQYLKNGNSIRCVKD